MRKWQLTILPKKFCRQMRNNIAPKSRIVYTCEWYLSAIFVKCTFQWIQAFDNMQQGNFVCRSELNPHGNMSYHGQLARAGSDECGEAKTSPTTVILLLLFLWKFSTCKLTNSFSKDRQEKCNSLSSTIPVQDLTAALPQYCFYCSSVSGLL